MVAPMPGSIVTVSVTVGDTVTRGQTLLVMESMKMETTIAAPRDGVIATVNFDKGQTIDRDALLLQLAPQNAQALNASNHDQTPQPPSYRPPPRPIERLPR